MSLTGEVHAVTYHNPGNDYVVAKVRAKSESGLVTIVGNLGSLTPGELVKLGGEWRDHPKFGRQFHVQTFEQAYPATINGIIRYLSSRMIKGLGPVMAKRLVDAFGERVLDILDTDPERLLTVEGVGKKKLAQILESWGEQREIRSLMLFLQTHGVPTTYAARIFRFYGARAVDMLKSNPYELAYYIRGIGFKTADEMAMRLGFAEDCQERLEAAMAYALFGMSEKGHLFCPREELLPKVAEMLGFGDTARLDEALEGLSAKKRVVVEDLPAQGVRGAVYLAHFYRFEREIAARLSALSAHPAPTAVDKVAKLLPGFEREARIELSPEQRQAVLGALGDKLFIITGGPGTGKTTITRMIVGALDKLGLSVKLAAPTGRAAKRMSEATGQEAVTLHRLLQYGPDGGFTCNEEHKIKADAVLVDEVSMLDVQLFVHLLRALPLTCRLILVGDVNQLPSVGPGNLLSDLLESEAVPSARLTHIYRQAQASYIVVNAHRINEGRFPVACPHQAPQSDFFWVEQDDPMKVQGLIRQLVTERIPAAYGLDPRRDVQVLTPMHKGEVGTHALNEILQERLVPTGPELVRGKSRFRRGDRVLQLKNDYERDVFNGDLGWIVAMDPERGGLTVDFDGRSVEYDATDLDELTLAYAVSVHKAQGSEYPAVIMPILTQHFMLLQKNLIYTGLTRARRLAVIIGSKKALGMGLNNRRSERRYTHLRFRLQEAFNSE